MVLGGKWDEASTTWGSCTLFPGGRTVTATAWHGLWAPGTPQSTDLVHSPPANRQLSRDPALYQELELCSFRNLIQLNGPTPEANTAVSSTFLTLCSGYFLFCSPLSLPLCGCSTEVAAPAHAAPPVTGAPAPVRLVLHCCDHYRVLQNRNKQPQGKEVVVLLSYFIFCIPIVDPKVSDHDGDSCKRQIGCWQGGK